MAAAPATWGHGGLAGRAFLAGSPSASCPCLHLPARRYSQPKSRFLFALGQLILGYSLDLFPQLVEATTGLEWWAAGGSWCSSAGLLVPEAPGCCVEHCLACPPWTRGWGVGAASRRQLVA
jgi:hypothetical protein